MYAHDPNSKATRIEVAMTSKSEEARRRMGDCGSMSTIVIPATGSPWYRSILAMTRSLGQENAVYVASTRSLVYPLERRLKSKFARDVLLVRHPGDDPVGFISDIMQHSSRYRFDFLLPYSDEVASVTCFYQERLGIQIPLPKYDTFAIAIDKKQVLELASSLGLPVPETFCSQKIRDVVAWMGSRGLRFPIVVKPRRRGNQVGTVVVHSKDELKQTLKAFRRIGRFEPVYDHTNPVFQQRVQGRVTDCCALYQHGRAKAMLTQERLEPPMGAGVVNVTTRNEEVMRQTRMLLDALDWHGPAQVEWIRDEEAGDYKLVEVNPRFWGTVELSIEAGLDFPKLAVAMMQGEQIKSHFQYEVGVKHRWVFPDQFASLFRYPGNRVRRFFSLMKVFDLWNPRTNMGPKLDDMWPDVFRLLALPFLLLEKKQRASQSQKQRNE